MAQVALKVDTSDISAAIEVIKQEFDLLGPRRDAFLREVNALFDADRAVDAGEMGEGGIEMFASPDLLALMRKYRIGR